MNTKDKVLSLFQEFSRVTTERRCPVCQRHDWCLIRNDGRACICARIKSQQKRGQAGWLHYVSEKPMCMLPSTEKVYIDSKQVQEYLYSVRGNSTSISRHAKSLGLSFASLVTMQARYDAGRAAIVFPMFNALRQPTGCRLRSRDRKWSLKGGREGVFMARAFRPSLPVFIAEGPTDSAALVEIGFWNVIGRPNCAGGAAIIRDLLADWPSTHVVIVADPDNPGIDGAKALAMVLPNPTVVIAGPSDIREFISTYGSHSDCRQCIIYGTGYRAAPLWRPVFRNKPGQYHDFTKGV